jgi:uracil DNA glycosylase
MINFKATMDRCHIGFSPIKADLERMWFEIQNTLKSIPVYSPQDKSCILNSLSQSPYGVRLIILGADPYPEDATGYAFETPDCRLTKHSLQQIARNLSCSIGVDYSNITHMTFQGVPGLFTLNAGWTVGEVSGGHINLWSKFVARVINFIIDISNVQVMIKFGSCAQYKHLTDLLKPIYVVKSFHPAAREGAFMKPDNRPFAEAYYVMKFKSIEEILWYKCFQMRTPIMRNIIIPVTSVISKSQGYNLMMIKDQMYKTDLVDLSDPNCYLGDIPSRSYLKLKSLYDNSVASLKRFNTKAKFDSSTFIIKQTYEIDEDIPIIMCNYKIENLLSCVVITRQSVTVRFMLTDRVAELSIPFLTKTVRNRLKITNYNTIYYTFRNQTLAYWIIYELFIAKEYIYDHQELVEILISNMYMAVKNTSQGSTIYSNTLARSKVESNMIIIPNVYSDVKRSYVKCNIYEKYITSGISLYVYNNDNYLSKRLTTDNMKLPMLVMVKHLNINKVITHKTISLIKLNNIRYHKNYHKINNAIGNMSELYCSELTNRVQQCISSVNNGKFYSDLENVHSVLDIISPEGIDGFSARQIDNNIKHKIYIRDNQIQILEPTNYDEVLYRINEFMKGDTWALA